MNLAEFIYILTKNLCFMFYLSNDLAVAALTVLGAPPPSIILLASQAGNLADVSLTHDPQD